MTIELVDHLLDDLPLPLLLGQFLIEESPGLGFRHGVDFLGAVFAVAAPTVAVYTIVKASEWGWGPIRI